MILACLTVSNAVSIRKLFYFFSYFILFKLRINRYKQHYCLIIEHLGNSSYAENRDEIIYSFEL